MSPCRACGTPHHNTTQYNTQHATHTVALRWGRETDETIRHGTRGAWREGAWREGGEREWMDGRTHLVRFVGCLDHLDRVALPRRVLELRVRAEVEAFRLQLRPSVGETCAPLDVAETAPQLQLPHLFRPLRGGRRLVTCACVCEMVCYVGAEISDKGLKSDRARDAACSMGAPGGRTWA